MYNTLLVIGVLIAGFQYNYINQDKQEAYCESLYMTNQIELMQEESCDIQKTAESINKTKRGY